MAQAKPRRAPRRPARRRAVRAAAPVLRPIGILRSAIRTRAEAPRQGHEGGVDAWLELRPRLAPALDGIRVGDALVVITWLHRGRRGVLRVVPRRYQRRREMGVFATRSPDRPNPLGLHPVTVREIDGTRLRVGPIEAIDGTPVVDLKPELAAPVDAQRRLRRGR